MTTRRFVLIGGIASALLASGPVRAVQDTTGKTYRASPTTIVQVNDGSGEISVVFLDPDRSAFIVGARRMEIVPSVEGVLFRLRGQVTSLNVPGRVPLNVEEFDVLVPRQARKP